MVTILERPTFKPASTGRAAIYIRVSSHKQEDGASLDVQLETCRTFSAKAGYDVVGEFRDVQSGLDIGRPAYQQALALARSGGFDYLVVYRYDRSGRDDAEYATMLRDFAKAGIQLVSASGEPIDPFSQRLMGLLAWNESRTISIRTSGAKMKRHSEGFWNGKPVFGYGLAKQQGGGTYLVPKEGEAQLVTELFSSYASGKVSLEGLRRNLADAGVRKTRFSIWYILKNRTYLGEVPHGIKSSSKFMPKPDLEWTPGKHLALTDRGTFDRVQARLGENARLQRQGPDKERYLFSGLVYCGSCGRRYTAKAKRDRGQVTAQYRCNGRISSGDCQAPFIHESRLRAAVIGPIKALLGRLSQEDIRAEVRRQLADRQHEADSEARISRLALEKELDRLQGRLSRLEDAYLDGDIDRESYRTRKAALPDQIADLKEQVAQLEAKPGPAVDLDSLFAMSDALEGQPPDDAEWREIISGVADRIVVEGSVSQETEGRGDKKAPATVHVEWQDWFKPLLEV